MTAALSMVAGRPRRLHSGQDGTDSQRHEVVDYGEARHRAVRRCDIAGPVDLEGGLGSSRT